MGHTAPNAGIGLCGHGVIVGTHDVALRRLRVRPGESGDGHDAVEFYDADHCTFMSGDDEVCSIVGLSDAISIQHCLIDEGLKDADLFSYRFTP